MLPLRGSFLSTNLQTLQPLCSPQQKFDNLSRCGTKTRQSSLKVSRFLHLKGLDIRWRFGRLVFRSDVVYYVNICLWLMFVYENKFSDNISQTQHSVIEHPPLRSPLICSGHSSLVTLLGKNIYIYKQVFWSNLIFRELLHIFVVWLRRLFSHLRQNRRRTASFTLQLSLDRWA